MADTKNAFAALEKENSASWNTASREALIAIDNAVKMDGRKEETKKILDAIKDPKKQQAVESAYKETLNDIKSTVKLGKDPKREDFINAIKKAEGIEKVLNDAIGRTKVILDHALIQILQDCVKIAAEALKVHKPGMIGAGAKAAKSKITSTVSGVVSGMASQLTEGVPFAPEMLAFAGTKIKGAFGGRGTSSAQKEMAAKLQGGDEDETAAEEQGGTSSPVEKAKEELLGGTSTGGGGDAGGGLEFTNELLINIDENLQFIRDNTETAESRRERLRKKGGAAAGGLLGKGKGKGKGIGGDDGDGFFGNLLGSFLGSGGGTGMGGAIKNYFKGGKGTGIWGKVLPKVLTVGRFIPIIGAIVAPLIDGIMGWFKADEWATSKSSAVIGAALGGTGSGASGAGWGALKGGMAGFAVGGPLGALAGVLIGAIAGWFGGKRIAEALDRVGNWFKEKWNSFLGIFDKDDKELTEKVHMREMREKREDLEATLAEEMAKKGKSLKEVQDQAAAGKGVIAAAQARRETRAFDQSKVDQLRSQIKTMTGQEQHYETFGTTQSAEQIQARVAELPGLIAEQEAKLKKIGTGRGATAARNAGNIVLKDLKTELTKKQGLLAKIPSGQEGMNLENLPASIGPDEDISAFVHRNEEVIEAEEVQALAKITNIAKELIKMYGKGAEYMFKDGGITYQAKGKRKTGEGSALQAVKLMTKFGISDFEHIWERDSKYGGDHTIDYGGGRVQMREDYDLMKNVMPGLIKQMKEINAAKLRLADMSQSGVSIPFEVAMKNIRGAQLNQAASNKVDIGGSGGGGVTNVNASTPVINNVSNNSVIMPETDGGRGRGLEQASSM